MRFDKKKNRHRGGRIFGRIVITCAVIGIVAVCGFAFYATTVWGTYDRDKLENFAQSTFVYDKNGNLIDSLYGSENRINVDISTLPEHVKNAFIAAEDVRFYSHIGVDPVRMVGAMIQNIKTSSLSEGASTITQQLIKLTHLTTEKLWSRKINEAYYAILVERDYTKSEILEMYINYIYFGNGAYGIQSAAAKYFGVEATDLTIAQAASLAAILKAPSTYSPHINAESNKKRRDMIIGIMLDEGMISEKDASNALATAVAIVDSVPGESFGWFVDEAIDRAVELLDISTQELLSGGYHIHTTLDVDAYLFSEKAAKAIADTVPKAANGASSQCAIVLMEKDGAVRAMIGGSAYSTARGLNRAMAKRQPGSAIKPLAVYAPSIELMGLQTVTFLDDAPQDFDGYSPSNYGGSYSGWVTARTAFEKSLNIPAVSLLNSLGVGTSLDYLRRFGVETVSSDGYLPLALGSMTYGASPYELCAAYLTFINDGIKPEPYMVTAIYDSGGKSLYTHVSSGDIVVSPSTAYLISDLMRTTAQNGTGRKLNALGYPIGAKTGTVGFDNGGNRDAWSIAITPNHAIAVWIGFDETTSQTYLDSSVTGSNQPTQAILDILRAYLPDGDGDFYQPAGVERIEIDAKTLWETGEAYLATDITPNAYRLSEVFSGGNRPTVESPFWQIPAAPRDLAITNSITWEPELTFTSTSDNARYIVYRRAGESTEIIDIIDGVPAGVEVVIVDKNAKWLMRNDYYVVAEHALAVDSGVENAVSEPSAIISFRPVFTPFGWSLDF